MSRRAAQDGIQLKMAPIVKEVEEVKIEVPEIDKLLERDPYLKPHEKEIRRR